MRLSAVFASGAIVLPAILIFGLVLLGSTPAWAQSTVTYSFCVYDTGSESDDRIDLTVGTDQIFTDHVLTYAESCQDVAVGVRIPTDLTITAVSAGVIDQETGAIRKNTGALVIRNPQATDKVIINARTKMALEQKNWDLPPNHSDTFTIWAISEKRLLLIPPEPEPHPKFEMNNVSEQVYTYTKNETIDDLKLPEAVGGTGTGPLKYGLSPEDKLPAGLKFDPINRRLYGMPTAVSPRMSYTYTVTDDYGRTSELSFYITVKAPPPEFRESESIPEQVYTQNETIVDLTLPEAVGYMGTGSLKYGLSPEDKLPAGLKFDPINRRLYGMPTAVSPRMSYTYTVTDIDERTSELSFYITVKAPPPEFRESESIPEQVYTQNETIVDLTLPEAVGYMGTGSLKYGLSPEDKLPAGLKFDPINRRLYGMPTAVSPRMSYTYTVTDIDERTSELSFYITVKAPPPEFRESESIPEQVYTQNETIVDLTLPEAVGYMGTGSLKYGLSPEDKLPAGLKFDPINRRLFGTPTEVSPRMSYTYTVTDIDERTSELSFYITVKAPPPEFRESESIPEQEYTVGETIEELTLPEADGGMAPLEYALSPALPDGLSFDQSTRRLFGTPTAVFPKTPYTYTVTDSDNRKSVLSFNVTVTAAFSIAEEKQTVTQTVAAVAATVVSNVTSNIGARLSAPSGVPSLNFAGSSVALEIGTSSDFRSGSRADRFSVLSGDLQQSQQRTMAVSELLRTGSFELVLGATEGNEDDVSDGLGQIAVWGRGDFQLFESGGGQNSSYDGNLRAGYLGADVVMSEGLLAGIAVSKIASKADYSLIDSTTGGGKLEAKLTNIHPYLRAAVSDRSEVWVILGFGEGQLTNISRATSLQSKSDLSMTMVSAGARHRLETDMGIDWAVLVDGSSASVETDDGVQLIDGITADVWRGRLGVEASYTTVSDDGSSLTSFLEVAGRKDGGDSVRGTGLEISPGLVFNNPENRLSVEARGRVLVLHSADNHREYGASITARLTPRANGLGLSMAVTPTWGTTDSSLNDATDAASLFRSNAADRRSRSLSLNTQIAYGFAARNGVLTPFTNYSLRDKDSSQLRIGLRYNLGSLVELELSGDRQENASKSPEHSVQFVGRVRF